MMCALRKFGSQDIGGDLLPIITRGLYRNPLDAFREYIQNSIDARAENIDINITPDIVSIKDDGKGMDENTASKSICLGISEKNPSENIGFRGIGIYSGFDLCKSLEIYTKSEDDDKCYIVKVEFAIIQKLLELDNQRKIQGKKSEVYLENLLSQSITIDIDKSKTIQDHGTLVILVGIKDQFFKRLNDKDLVTKYLQNVIPLPFFPEFKYKDLINDKFKEEDYRIVKLNLKIGSDKIELYRPYENSFFDHGGLYEPKFFDLKNPKTNKKFGFAWVCINDARKVLKNSEIRGLLIKKFGFSISTREYLESFFARTVFNRRITGEVIVQHKDLIPNAARSDFEPNDIRDEFYHSLSKLATDISHWANNIQEELKANEELDEISQKAMQVNVDLPRFKRDLKELLSLSIELNGLEKRLKTHRSTLLKIRNVDYKNTEQILEKNKQTIENIILSKRKSSINDSQIISQSVSLAKKAPKVDELKHIKDIPDSILELMESLDILITPPIKIIIQYMEEEIIKPNISNDEYINHLKSLRNFLEEKI